MGEYAYQYEAPRSAGRLVFEIRNTGRLSHELVVVVLPEDVPPIDEQLHSENRIVIPNIASIAPQPPGGRGTFAVDLEPGRYALLCFVREPDGEPHALKGMNSEFTIG
jgi:hypothetical protein